MKSRTFLVALMLGLLAIFVAINWPVFVAPTSLTIGLASFQMPLGLLMLGVVAAFVVTFIALLATAQTGALLAARRHAKEAQQLRDVADRAEASRLADLRSSIDERFVALHARLERMEQTHRAELRDAANSLAAMIGEIDDRVYRRPELPSS